jgi:hypothetical protein
VGSCSQEKSATKCVTVKVIWVGAGPLPSPVYRLFGLVGVGPYRSLERVQITIPGGQVNGFLKKVLEKSDRWGLTFGPGGVECTHDEQQIMEAGSEG